MAKSKKELRLGNLLERRDTLGKMTEEMISAVEFSDSKVATEEQRETLSRMREDINGVDVEIEELAGDIEKDREASLNSARVRNLLARGADGVEDLGEDGIVYRDFYAYARDVVLTRSSRGFATIAGQFDRAEIDSAKERISLLERTSYGGAANTLTANLGGLNPPQHIAQIFQVINKSRPLVDSATRTTLERGTLTYPKVTTRPVVAVQASEKTKAGDTGMVVDLEQAQASTYLGGGDLSWQQLNWSTPDALQLWFNLAAADYALQTEVDAGNVVSDAGFAHILSSPFGATGSYADFLTAIGAGASAVYANSGRQADTIYLSEDRFWYMFGLTSAAFAQFATVGENGIGPLKIVRTRGMDSGEIVVGDSSALLVAETAGAPVELRAVEPAIGGLEVGIIGAFEAVVVDAGSFCLLTTAS